MYKIIITHIIVTLLPILCAGQKIKVDKVDEFTHARITETSWENFHSFTMYRYIRLRRVDSTVYFNLRMTNGVSSFESGKPLMLKIKGDSIITLINQTYTLSCMGCGSIGLLGSGGYGIDILIPITTDQMQYLSKNNVEKIRVYLSRGYEEFTIDNDKAKTLSALFALLLK